MTQLPLFEEPIRPDHWQRLERLLKHIYDVTPLVQDGGEISARTPGTTAPLCAHLRAAAQDLRHLLAADRVAEERRQDEIRAKERRARRATGKAGMR